MPGHHHHVDPDAGDAGVFWAVAVNLALTAAQIPGGALSASRSDFGAFGERLWTSSLV